MYRKKLFLIALALTVIIAAVFISMETDSSFGIGILFFFAALPAAVAAYYILRFLCITAYSYFGILLQWIYQKGHKKNK